MQETRFEFPALSVYTRVGIFRSASETDDTFYLPNKIRSCMLLEESELPRSEVFESHLSDCAYKDYVYLLLQAYCKTINIK